MLDAGTERTVAFPAGDDWVYLFNRARIFEGGTEETLTVPIEEFPVFLRQGSEIETDLAAWE